MRRKEKLHGVDECRGGTTAVFHRQRVLTINDFVEQLGESISSIYRTVITLTELNYLNKIERNNHELGPMFLSNSFIYLAFREIVEIASPYLLELRDESRVLS